MSITNEFITFKEFAESTGVTIQTIYKRAKTDLKPFVKQVKEGKVIDTRALELFDSPKFKPGDKDAINNANESLKVFNDHLIKENEYLKGQLEKLQRELSEARSQLDARLEQALKLNENFQSLQKQINDNQLLTLEAPKWSFKRNKKEKVG